MPFFNFGKKNKIPKVQQKERIDIDTTVFETMSQEQFRKLTSYLESVKKVNRNRHDLYNEYRKMIRETSIATVIDLIADECTQEDLTVKKSIWAVPVEKDKEGKIYRTSTASDFVNKFLDEVKMDDKLFSIAYNLLLYGDVFIRTYDSLFSEYIANSNTFEKTVINDGVSYKETQYLTEGAKKKRKTLAEKRGKYFEIHNSPWEVAHIKQFDEDMGYILTETLEGNKQKTTLYSKDEFIHIYNDKGYHRDILKLQSSDIVHADDSTSLKINEHEFKVVYGTSHLEACIEAYSVVDLIETSLITTRFTKSQLYRLFQIEVGNMSDTQANKVLNDFKRNINTSMTIDTNAKEMLQKKNPLLPLQNLYTTTRDGKGNVQIESIGGDYDLKDISDLEHYNSKLFAGLRTPKVFAGYEEPHPGSMGNISLTKLDIRFARTVRRYQKLLKEGVKKIIDYYLTVSGNEKYIDKYELMMPAVSTAEEMDKKEETTQSLQLIETLKNLVSDMEGIDLGLVLKQAFRDYIPNPEIISIIDGLKDEAQSVLLQSQMGGIQPDETEKDNSQGQSKSQNKKNDDEFDDEEEY